MRQEVFLYILEIYDDINEFTEVIHTLNQIDVEGKDCEAIWKDLHGLINDREGFRSYINDLIDDYNIKQEYEFINNDDRELVEYIKESHALEHPDSYKTIRAMLYRVLLLINPCKELAAAFVAAEVFHSAYLYYNNKLTAEHFAKDIGKAGFVAIVEHFSTLGLYSGAVSGFVSGGPFGAVTGGLIGYFCGRLGGSVYAFPVIVIFYIIASFTAVSEDVVKAYQYFKLETNAADAEIAAAYKQLAVKWHPDKPGGDHEEFCKLQQNYLIILASRGQKC